jgi:hypothetical protein
MSTREITPRYIADHIRRVLKDGGSAPHSEDVQHFFKEVIKSRGWYTAELRKFAVRFRRSIIRERGMDFLVQVADQLFSGRILEEKVMAVFLLEKQTKNFGDERIPALCLLARPRNQLGRSRRAGARSAGADGGRRTCPLPPGFPVGEVAESLAAARRVCGTDPGSARAAVLSTNRAALESTAGQDEDDMVQKGLGWLLRETAKADPKRTVPYLMKIRKNAPRLVLRTACETLPVAARRQVLRERAKS